MIKSTSFRNFKSLRHVDVDFERLIVIVGPNASGNTSVLEGLHYLSQVSWKSPRAPANAAQPPDPFTERPSAHQSRVCTSSFFCTMWCD
jgi:AAA15 family ATPase/GTPase